jgi:mRNA interferase MazF
VVSPYVPDSGHVIKIDFDPHAGHEQGGWRPALVLSPVSYNRRSGLAIVVPITSHVKGYPFEVPVACRNITGVVLADAIKSVDWRARNARYVEAVSDAVLASVRARVAPLLGLGR